MRQTFHHVLRQSEATVTRGLQEEEEEEEEASPTQKTELGSVCHREVGI